MLRAGLGSSESKKNPFCTDDHLIVEPVLMKSPRKFCASFTTVARLISPLHSTSKDTVAGAGAIGGMPILANPCPWVSEFARSWASGTERPSACIEMLKYAVQNRKLHQG